MRPRTGIGALIAISLFALANGCNSGVSDKSLRFVDPDQAIELAAGRDSLLGLGGKKGGAYVDPRPEAAFEAGHIPGAIHLPFDRVRLDHHELDEAGALIVYGDDYNDAVALAMSKRLMELGHEDVRTLRGGLRAWKAAGNAVETGK